MEEQAGVIFWSSCMHYDPDIYGWSQMSKKMQSQCRETVFSNIRKTQVLYFNHIPVETFDETDYCSDERFVRKVMQLDKLSGEPPEVYALLTMEQRHDGGANPYLPQYTVEWGPGRPAKFVELTNLTYLMCPGAIMTKPVDYNFAMTLLKIRPGDPPTVTNFWDVQRTEQNKFIINWKFRLSLNAVLTTRRQDLELVQDAFQQPEYRGLETFGPEKRVHTVFSLMAQRRYIEIYDQVCQDFEIHMLPAPPTEGLHADELTPAPQKATVKQKKKGKAKVLTQKTSPAAGPSFVQQPRERVFRMRTQDMLDMIGHGKHPHYRDVCPTHTHPDVRGSYSSALACSQGQNIEEMRRRRDQGIACGLLRQRASYRYGSGMPASDSHQHPISLAYGFSRGCSDRVCGSAGATEGNRDIGAWLQLKGPYIQGG